LIYRFGQFSHLWAEMGKRLGFDVEIHEETWGKGIPLDKLEARLKRRYTARNQGCVGDS